MHHQTFLPSFTGSVLALWNLCVCVCVAVYMDVVFDITVKKKKKHAAIPGGPYS